MKRLFVTGGCGYIGSHTCYVLLEAGYEIIVIDSNVNSTEISLESIKKLNYSKVINIANLPPIE